MTDLTTNMQGAPIWKKRLSKSPFLIADLLAPIRSISNLEDAHPSGESPAQKAVRKTSSDTQKLIG